MRGMMMMMMMMMVMMIHEREFCDPKNCNYLSPRSQWTAGLSARREDCSLCQTWQCHDVTGNGSSTPTGISKKSPVAWRYLNSAREKGDGTGVCCDACTVFNCKVK